MDILKTLLLTALCTPAGLFTPATLSAQQLEMTYEDEFLTISGLEPGCHFGIVFGFTEVHDPLPGGVVLRLRPVSVYYLGKANLGSAISFHVGPVTTGDGKLRFLAQALALNTDGTFSASPLKLVAHNGTGLELTDVNRLPSPTVRADTRRVDAREHQRCNRAA